jgi:peptide/nickel transport system substrate-binding protein
MRIGTRIRQWAARRGRVLLALAAVAALTGGLAGCGATPTAAQVPNTLTIALGAQSTLDWWPPIVPGNDCYTLTGGGVVGPDMYMPLLWINRHDGIDFARSIANRIQVSDNYTRFTVTLNPKWHWSNGQPVTAQDVVYDWTLIHAASMSNSPLPYCYAGVGGVPQDWASVRATSPTTVVVQTRIPVNPVWFEHNGLGQLVPIPRQVWDRYANVDQELAWIKSIANDPQNPVYRVVDGPYRIAQAVTDQYWRFVANPRYDGTKPRIKTVLYDYETSDAAIFAQLKKGTVDIAAVPFSYYEPAQHLSGYRLIREDVFAFDFIHLNFHADTPDVGPLFNHLYIRQALQLGIDQPAIIQSLYHGLATPTYGPVPYRPANIYYDAALKNPYPYDPARGRALLEQHGWRMVNGVMTRGSVRLVLPYIYPAASATLQHIAELLKQSWAQEGIQINLEPLGGTLYLDTIGVAANSDKWAIAGRGVWIYFPDYFPSGGALFTTNAGVNFGGYGSNRMNQLVAATYQGGTPAQIRQRLDAYQVYAAEQLPVLYVPTPGTLYAVRDDVTGFQSQYNAIVGYTPDNRIAFTAP